MTVTNDTGDASTNSARVFLCRLLYIHVFQIKEILDQ